MTPHQHPHHSIEQVGIEEAAKEVLLQKRQVVAKTEQRVGGDHASRHYGRDQRETIADAGNIPVDEAGAFESRIGQLLSRHLRRDETFASIDVHLERGDVFAVGDRQGTART